MAYASNDFSQNLVTGPCDHEITLNADRKLGLLVINVDPTTLTGDDHNAVVRQGLQENVQVFYTPNGVAQPKLIHSGNFNGKASFVWAPVGNWVCPSGAKITIKVSNNAGWGTIYGSLTVE